MLFIGGLHALLSLIAYIFVTLLYMKLKLDVNDHKMMNENLDLRIKIDAEGVKQNFEEI